MTLTLVSKYRGEVAADLLQYYGLSLEDAARLPATRVGLLIRHLPASSRLQQLLNPDAALDYGDLVLRQLEFDVRTLLAGLSGKRGAAKQQPLPLPGETQAHKPTGELAARAQQARVSEKLGIKL